MKEKARRSFLNYYLNIISVLLLLITLMFIPVKLSFFVTGAFNCSPNQSSRLCQLEHPKRSAVHSPNILPSIYYIVLDSYTSNAVFKRYCSYDNSPFLLALKKKGFFVVSRATSNYPRTALSLPSVLNMNYYAVPEIALSAQADALDPQQINWLWQHSKVEQILSAQGYQVIMLKSWAVELASLRAPSDMNAYKNFFNSEFNMVLLQMTVLRPWYLQIVSPLLRAAVLSTFAELENISDIGGPKFVYAHIMCPHPPYIFGSDGRPINLAEGVIGRINQPQLYVNQVKFINQKMLHAIDKIMSHSRVKPIIVLQGDHGIAGTFYPMGLDKTNNAIIKAQFEVLNALYLPKESRKYFYDNLSLVNTFRIIMNTIFHEEKYPLLKDKSFYSTLEQPFDFVDVTSTK
jgi:hypothetical protein